jgi:DNA-binding Lrp family transcriptional regulator
MIDPQDLRLIKTIQHGLPITPRPYEEIGKQIGMAETEVIERISLLKQTGLIKRLGVIVKHQRLGYIANAMVVFNIPDHLVNDIGKSISQARFVNLCYQRPRQGSQWPYNLYCMIHGKSRTKVFQQLQQLTKSCDLDPYDREILFSKQCFKQRGAIYYSSSSPLSFAHG